MGTRSATGQRDRLRARREELRLSLDQLAHAVDVDRKTVWRWETGRSNPYGRHHPAIADTLRWPLDRIEELLARDAQDGSLDALTVAQADDGEPFDLALAALADRGAGRIGPRQVDAHREMEEALAGLYRSADPSAVLPATRAYADSLLDLLDRFMGERVRAELGGVAAGVHAQVGLWACHMHRPHLASRYLTTACELAMRTGDSGLRARTLGALSYLYSSAPRGGTGGRPGHALALLDQALDLAQDSDSFTKGWLATWRADQYATLGNLDAARTDVDAADGWLSAGDDGSLRGFFARSSYGYGMASHLDSVRGLVLALGGEAVEADRCFTHVQDNAPNVRRWIATQEHRALGDVEAGEPERACTALGTALALATREDYGMGLMRAFGVRRRFDPGWSSMACVRDLDEQMHAAVLGS